MSILSLILIVVMAAPTEEVVKADGQAALKRTVTISNLPIDCGFGQVCTGTQCVAQQVVQYCGDTEYVCQNDTQEWVGGNTICCTGRQECFSCGRTQSDGSIRIWRYNSYFGVTKTNCVPNP